jgi:hypothetical protein
MLATRSGIIQLASICFLDLINLIVNILLQFITRKEWKDKITASRTDHLASEVGRNRPDILLREVVAMLQVYIVSTCQTGAMNMPTLRAHLSLQVRLGASTMHHRGHAPGRALRPVRPQAA